MIITYIKCDFTVSKYPNEAALWVDMKGRPRFRVIMETTKSITVPHQSHLARKVGLEVEQIKHSLLSRITYNQIQAFFWTFFQKPDWLKNQETRFFSQKLDWKSTKTQFLVLILGVFSTKMSKNHTKIRFLGT